MFLLHCLSLPASRLGSIRAPLVVRDARNTHNYVLSVSAWNRPRVIFHPGRGFIGGGQGVASTHAISRDWQVNITPIITTISVVLVGNSDDKNSRQRDRQESLANAKVSEPQLCLCIHMTASALAKKLRQINVSNIVVPCTAPLFDAPAQGELARISGWNLPPQKLEW